MSRIGYYNVKIQRFDKGEPSTVLIAHKVVGISDEVILKRAKRELNVKDTKTTIWRFIEKDLIKYLGDQV